MELGFKCDPCTKPFIWNEYPQTDAYWLPRTRKEYEIKLSLFATEVDVELNDTTKELSVKNQQSKLVYIGKHYTGHEISIDQNADEIYSFSQSDSTSCHCIQAPYKNFIPISNGNVYIGLNINGQYYWAKQAHFIITGENGVNQTSTLSKNFLTELSAYCMFLKENGTIKIDFIEFEGMIENGVPEKYFIKNICVQYKK